MASKRSLTALVILVCLGSARASAIAASSPACGASESDDCLPELGVVECDEVKDNCCPLWRQRIETDSRDWLDCWPSLG